ncbi:MAG: GGDEF domain-containing protein [Candidatus Saccharimonadales bacterium]
MSDRISEFTLTQTQLVEAVEGQLPSSELADLDSIDTTFTLTDEATMQAFKELAEGRPVAPEALVFLGGVALLVDDVIKQKDVENGVLRVENAKVQADKEESDRLAKTDSLTGVYNRSATGDIISRAAIAVLKDTTSRKVLEIDFVDINYLKDVNDIFGHIYGDMLIKRVANSIKSWVQVLGIGLEVVRNGGDELTTGGAVDRIRMEDTGSLQDWVNRELMGFVDELPASNRRQRKAHRKLGSIISVSVGTVFFEKAAVQAEVDRVRDDSLNIETELQEPTVVFPIDVKKQLFPNKPDPKELEKISLEDIKAQVRSLPSKERARLADGIALERVIERVHKPADDEMYENKIAMKKRHRRGQPTIVQPKAGRRSVR